jgi:uncharacterized repeat protein (TIGR03803 family)
MAPLEMSSILSKDPLPKDHFLKDLPVDGQGGSQPSAIKRTCICAAWLALAMLTTVWAHAQTFAILHTFTGTPDGATPEAGLLRDSEGNLYGTTNAGGASGNGTVFEISNEGVETILYSFAGWPDGSQPSDALIEDAEGNLYGTTVNGGRYSDGTVFKLTKSGVETVLHNFGGSSDGSSPEAGVTMDAAGNLYGTTLYGGGGNCMTGCGTIFKVTAAGVETVLYSFQSGDYNGYHPQGGLVLSSAGNLYGTTTWGGRTNCGAFGCGVIYELYHTPKGWAFSTLHRFSGAPSDGEGPTSAMIFDSAGNLFGTTTQGGANNQGTIFQYAPTGSVYVLHSFNFSDGSDPYGGVVRDAAGNFYGATAAGPDTSGCAGYGCGTIFKMTPEGTLTTLFAYPNSGSEGYLPDGGLVRDPEGNLYGTTRTQEVSPYDGNVFELTP